MSVPLEHNYMSLTEKISAASSPSVGVAKDKEKSSGFDLKETELRLGLPGSFSPERKPGHGLSLFGKDLEDKHDGYSPNPLKNPVSGAKRGFLDAIDESPGKWMLSASNSKAEVDLGKGVALFSPRGVSNGGKPLAGETQQAPVSAPKMNGAVFASQVAKPVMEKKPQGTENAGAPAAK